MKGVTTLLEFQDVKWQLPSGEPIIKGITCKLDSRLTVITGPNGGGKTSLAKLIAGVEKCTSGKILLDGTDIPQEKSWVTTSFVRFSARSVCVRRNISTER